MGGWGLMEIGKLLALKFCQTLCDCALPFHLLNLHALKFDRLILHAKAIVHT